MSNLSGFVKRLRDIMRNDAGINGDAQRIEQIAWMCYRNSLQIRPHLFDLAAASCRQAKSGYRLACSRRICSISSITDYSPSG